MNTRFMFIIALCICIIPFLSYAKPDKDKRADTLETQTREIVISALRYPESILEIPLSVSSIRKSSIEGIRGISVDEPLFAIPGILAQSRNGGTDIRLTIRGFGARGAGDRSNSGTSRGIRFYLDGIPETEPDGRTSLDYFDMSIIDNIEIIRSNASSIWGNAAGGVLTYSTLPEVNKSFLEAGYLAGSFGLQKFNINLASKLGDGMVKLSFVNHRFDGFRENSMADRTLFNLSLRSANPYLSFHFSGVNNKFYIPGPLTQAIFDASPENANAKYLTNRERRENKILRIGVNFSQNLTDNQALSAMAFATPKYLQRSERGTYRDFNRYHVGGNLSYKNQSDIFGLPNTLLLGLDNQYQNGSALFYRLDSSGNRSSELTSNKAEGANNFGAFIQDEIFIDNFSFLFGLRYDAIQYNNNDFMTAENASKEFDKLTPKFAVSYELDPNHYLFANIGGGVEVPAGNETDPSPYLGQDTVYLFNPLLEPIKSTTFEIGSKNHEYFYDSFFSSVEYELALYYILIENDIVPYQGGKFYFTAGKSSRLGTEGKLTINTSAGVSFKTGITFMNSKYDEYLIDSVHYDVAKIGRFADYSGNKAAGIPDLSVNAGLNYYPVFLDKLNLALNMIYLSKYFADDANKYEIPSYLILNFKASYKLNLPSISSGFHIYAGVNNLLDLKYASSAFINPEIEKITGLPYYLEPGMPRNIYAGISYTFE